MSAHRDTTTRVFFLGSFAAALLLMLAVYLVLGPVSAVKGGYVLIGLGIAGAVHQLHVGSVLDTASGWSESSERATASHWSDYGKIVFILLVLGVVGADQLGSRTFLILIVLPVCYLMLGIQLWQRAAVPWLLLQSIGLFLTSSVTQYLTNGFFFSRGDTLSHVRWTELVVVAGTPEAIPSESFYSSFPGLHTFLASISVLTDLPPYDVYMLAGIITYGIIILVVYCLGRYFFDPRSGLYVAVAMTLLTPVIIHSAYFFPQSLFFGLLYILLFISFRTNSSLGVQHVWFTLISLLLVSVLVFIHHLSVVLLIPIVGALVVIPPLANRLLKPFQFDVVAPWSLPFVALIFASFAYWVLGDTFLMTFIDVSQDILRDTLIASDTTAPRQYIVLGETLPELTFQTAFFSLFSPDGIYNAVLIALLALGMVTILYRIEFYRHAIGLIFLGSVGSLLVLRTPLALRGINRMRLPVSIFVAVIVGIGLYRLFSLSEGRDLRIVPVLLVFVLVATSAHAAAGIDVYNLHSGPDLWEKQSMPDSQTEFTDQEHHSLEEITQFIERQDPDVTTDWITNNGIVRRFGGNSSGALRVNEDSLETERGFLLYRDRWSSHSQTVFLKNTTYTFAVSERWLTRTDRHEHKIYTTGETSLVADHHRSDYFEEDVS